MTSQLLTTELVRSITRVARFFFSPHTQFSSRQSIHKYLIQSHLCLCSQKEKALIIEEYRCVQALQFFKLKDNRRRHNRSTTTNVEIQTAKIFYQAFDNTKVTQQQTAKLNLFINNLFTINYYCFYSCINFILFF